MWARTKHFALFLVVTGSFGCSATERLYHRTVTSTVEMPKPKPPANNFPHETIDSSLPNSAASDVADQPVVQEKLPLGTALEVKPTTSTTWTEQKLERPENLQKTVP